MGNGISTKSLRFSGRSSKRLALLLVLSLAILFCGCKEIPLKISTIRPTEIVLIVVEDQATGDRTELVRDVDTETDWLMDDLVLLMEEKYINKADCSPDDSHLYHVYMYTKSYDPDQESEPELEFYVNEDASVCHSGMRKVQTEDAYQVMDFAVWADLFE
jgi:hypothetical protein